MFITRQHLSRRAVLKGMGATVALPFLDAMTPAGTLFAQASKRPVRLIAMEMVHGAAGSTTFGIKNNFWAPAQVGSAFDLAKKRIQVAMSAGMALVESSPKREIKTDQWVPDGPHEAPPVAGGILPLYNRGDRRRWYWPCLDGCGEPFEAPALPLFDPSDNPQEAAASAHVACPHCGQVYWPKDKARLNILRANAIPFLHNRENFYTLAALNLRA